MENTFSVNTNQNKSYIAFFDLDKTLIRANSSVILLRVAYRKKMISIKDILKALWLSLLFRFNLRETERIIGRMVRWLSGVSENSLGELISDAFEEQMKNLIPESAKSEIRSHKDKNAHVVILSSALYPVCRIFADYLDMDDIICTMPESSGGIYTGKPAGRLCFGKEKRSRLTGYCEKNNKQTEDAWFYSDSADDLPSLEIVGHPVCVNPDRKLKTKAAERGWPVCIW
ncbi:MAG TPA: HAD-IB family hydrolase [Bacteroidales bacterium]|nr:HAD-IB family hydrolase [Bacteroidales bacterium]